MTRLGQRLLAEFVGCLFLAATVVGSGIAAQTLSPRDIGLQLAENATATALALLVLIAVLAPISGAHFNPVISLADAVLGRRSWPETGAYVGVQIVGCVAGVVLANVMFAASPVSISTHDRLTPPHWLAEVVATAGLVIVVFVLARTGRERLAPFVVAAYIGAAYFFTSSTSFANPAITLGRTFTNSFAGIQPGAALAFITAQIVGGALGLVVARVLTPARARTATLDTKGATP
jgi:arsenate reductase